MTGAEMILAALTAGAGAGTTEAAKTAVTDAYAGLRNLLRRRLAGHRRAQEPLQSEQGDWQVDLREEIIDSGADQDEEILAAARRLLQVLDPDGARRRKYTVDLSSAQGIQVGDGNVHVVTAHGAVAGTMNGPVTVINNPSTPDPPAPPEA